MRFLTASKQFTQKFPTLRRKWQKTRSDRAGFLFAASRLGGEGENPEAASKGETRYNYAFITFRSDGAHKIQTHGHDHASQADQGDGAQANMSFIHIFQLVRHLSDPLSLAQGIYFGVKTKCWTGVESGMTRHSRRQRLRNELSSAAWKFSWGESYEAPVRRLKAS